MNNRKLLLFTFVVVVLAQLFVPSKMIWDREDTLKTGTEFKFKTTPIDPSDPFRGKYITLNYEENSYPIQDGSQWSGSETCFLSVTTDEEGFAKIDSVTKLEPQHSDFVKAKVYYVIGDELFIDYPFERYYMEESKAYPAELVYRESQRDTSTNCYALVSVKNGDAVLKDVMINGSSIVELIKNKN